MFDAIIRKEHIKTNENRKLEIIKIIGVLNEIEKSNKINRMEG